MSRVEPYEQSDMEFLYEVGRVGERAVCMEASLTNQTAHSSFISRREGFDAQGFPRVWKRTTIKPGSPAKELDVVFKEVELDPTFRDGKPIQPLTPMTSTKRAIVLCVLGLVTLAMGVALIRVRGNKFRV